MDGNTDDVKGLINFIRGTDYFDYDADCDLFEKRENPLADIYNSLANTNYGSCIAVIYGCTDINAFNFNPNATQDNNSCVQLVTGCINPFASNYNDQANQDDGSCIFGVEGCTDPFHFILKEIDSFYVVSCE